MTRWPLFCLALACAACEKEAVDAPLLNPNIAASRGYDALNQGDLRTARAYFDLALQADPENSYALLGREMVTFDASPPPDPARAAEEPVSIEVAEASAPPSGEQVALAEPAEEAVAPTPPIPPLVPPVTLAEATPAPAPYIEPATTITLLPEESVAPPPPVDAPLYAPVPMPQDRAAGWRGIILR